MPFFDFHIHPTLKCMFSEKENKTDPWKDIDTTKIQWFIRWCSEFEYILNSQTNLRQLFNNGVNLACITIFTPDPAFTKAKLILKQAEGTLSTYLNPKRLKKINEGDLKPYPDLVHEDIFEVLLNPSRFGISDKKIKPLLKSSDYDERDHNTLHAVFSVEGCHTLSSTVDKDKIDLNDVLNNLEDLRKRGLPIISVNVTHLEQYKFCNHAYGILFIGSTDFNPTGDRISNEGIEIIKHCYERNILIDIKHTSLGARRMIIEDVRNRASFTPINQPLVCTHAGFTGLSYNDIPDYILDRRKDRDSTYILWGKPRRYFHQDAIAFNPSSINLYDEDIIAILRSGGLIGLSLDKRILGFSEADGRPPNLDDLTFEEEFISNQEANLFFSRNFGAKANEDFCITSQEVIEGGIVNPDAAFYHLKHFLAHVGHLIFVANKFQYEVNKALQQVCIGSDFDGLINPVWCCDTVNALPQLQSDFIKHFPSFARANKDIVKLPEGFDVKRFASQLFFENGRNFVLERVDRIRQKKDI